jgi:hypothetical protein
MPQGPRGCTSPSPGRSPPPPCPASARVALFVSGWAAAILAAPTRHAAVPGESRGCEWTAGGGGRTIRLAPGSALCRRSTHGAQHGRGAHEQFGGERQWPGLRPGTLIAANL